MANLGQLIPALFTGKGGELLTPEQIKRRQDLANSAMAFATDSSPNAGGVASILAKGLAGFRAGYENNRAEAGIQAAAKENQSLVANLLSGFGGGQSQTAPAVAQTVAPSSSSNTQNTSVDPVNISADKQTFINALLPAAIEESARTGIDPRIIVAQAAQETGWGRSAPGNNYFGIKSHGQSGGQNLTTHEVINGQRVKINDSFRTFGSPADSVRGYGDFIIQNPRYKPLREAQGLDAQLAALQSSGYATDPNYSKSVGDIARTIQIPQGQTVATTPITVSASPTAGGSGINPAIVAALSSPVANAQTQNVAGLLLNQQFSQQEAARQAAAAQAKIAAEWQREDRQRAEDRSFALNDRNFDATRQDNRWSIEDSRNDRDYNYKVQNDSRTRQDTINQQNRDYDYRIQNDAANRQAPTANMREYEAYAADERASGRQPVGRLEYEQSLRKSGANNTNISLNGEKFDEKFGELDAKALSDTATAGIAAQRNLGRIDLLERSLSQIPSGAEANFKQIAGNYGINIGKDTSNIQAAQALINSLVPEQRQPGSGPMSDADLELFKQSLPRIINQPGGNQQIIDTMRGIAQYDADGAKIIQRLRLPEGDPQKLTRSQAFEALQNRANPLSNFTQPDGGASETPTSLSNGSGWREVSPGIRIRPKGGN